MSLPLSHVAKSSVTVPKAPFTFRYSTVASVEKYDETHNGFPLTIRDGDRSAFLLGRDADFLTDFATRAPNALARATGGFLPSGFFPRALTIRRPLTPSRSQDEGGFGKFPEQGHAGVDVASQKVLLGGQSSYCGAEPERW
jgi:hypothetical protein